MISISSDVGLWIVEAYRRMASQLHVTGKIDGKDRDSSGVIAETSPIDRKICLVLFDEEKWQNEKCFASLADAKFLFDPVGDPAGESNSDFGRSRSSLEIELANGARLLLVERFIGSG